MGVNVAHWLEVHATTSHPKIVITMKHRTGVFPVLRHGVKRRSGSQPADALRSFILNRGLRSTVDWVWKRALHSWNTYLCRRRGWTRIEWVLIVMDVWLETTRKAMWVQPPCLGRTWDADPKAVGYYDVQGSFREWVLSIEEFFPKWFWEVKHVFVKGKGLFSWKQIWAGQYTTYIPGI